jgi:hypothetical protein
MFQRYAEARGIRRGSGKGDPSGKADTESAFAEGFGINERTARRRLAVARLPDDLREDVREGRRTTRTALQENGRR